MENKDLTTQTQKQLVEICFSLGIKHKKNDVKSLLIDLINKNKNNQRDGLDNDLKKNEQICVSEKNKIIEKVKIDGRKRYFLPILFNELIFFWERGYICHPKILNTLVKRTHPDYETCQIVDFEQIELTSRYPVKFEVLLEFAGYNESVNSVITSNWITPFLSVKNIFIDNKEDKDILIRLLRATNKGFNDKDYRIEVNNFNELYINGVEKELKGQAIIIEESDLLEFMKLDSIIGGIAVSAFIEKSILLKGHTFFKKTSIYGTIGARLLDVGTTLDLTKITILNYVINALGAKYGISDDTDQFSYIKHIFDLILKRDNEGLEKLVFDHQRKESSRIAPATLKLVQSHLNKSAIINVINEIPKEQRDPFLIFIAFINQYPNIGVPASNDRQSFLFAVKDLFSKGDINAQESIIICYCLGAYLGYPMCWNPVLQEEKIEWVDDKKLNNLLFNDLHFCDVLVRVIPKMTNLKMNQFFDHKFKKEIGLDKELKSIVWPNNRSVSFGSEIISFEDKDLQLFEIWMKKTKDTDDKVLFYLLFEETELITLDLMSRIKNKIETDRNEVLEDIKRRIARSEISDVQRRLIRVLCI